MRARGKSARNFKSTTLRECVDRVPDVQAILRQPSRRAVQDVGSSRTSATVVSGLSDQKSVADQLRPGASSTPPLLAFRKLALARPSSTWIAYLQFRLMRMNTRWVRCNGNDFVHAGSRRSRKSPSRVLSAPSLKSSERSRTLRGDNSTTAAPCVQSRRPARVPNTSAPANAAMRLRENNQSRNSRAQVRLSGLLFINITNRKASGKSHPLVMVRY